MEVIKQSKFNKRVWDQLKLIPKGRVMTYGELARAVGCPGAARAVARACAANPYPVVVPCHRVVMSNGELGGYSAVGGIKQKEVLLKNEGVPIVNGYIQKLKKCCFIPGVIDVMQLPNSDD